MSLTVLRIEFALIDVVLVLLLLDTRRLRKRLHRAQGAVIALAAVIGTPAATEAAWLLMSEKERAAANRRNHRGENR